MSREPDLEGAMSPADFQAKYGIRETKFYEELKTGRLNAVKCGRRILVPINEADRWFNALPPYRPAPPQALVNA